VTSLLHAIKIRASIKGAAATRQHAEAISIEEIQTLMQWSEKTCPNELLEMPVPNVETLMFRLEHALMRAFVTSAFTLWTRWDSPPLTVQIQNKSRADWSMSDVLNYSLWRNKTSSRTVQGHNRTVSLTSRSNSRIGRDGSMSKDLMATERVHTFLPNFPAIWLMVSNRLRV